MIKVAWNTTDGDSFYIQRDPSGVWSSQRNLNATSGTGYLYKMVTDPAGLTHLLWGGTTANGTTIFYRAESGIGHWSQWVNLCEGRYCYFRDMAIDAHGAVHVVWSGDPGGENGVFYRMRPAGGPWSAVELISDSRAFGVSLAVDALKRVHVAWGESPSYWMFYAMRSDGVWSIPKEIASPTTVLDDSAPKLVVDASLKVHLVWKLRYGANMRYVVRSPDGNWSSPVDFGQSDFDRSQPQLLVDSSDTPHVLWRNGITTMGHNGAVMYAGPGPVPAAGEATLSQVVQVPDAALAPTLSFLHRFATEFPSDSRLEVVIDDGISPTTVFSVTSGTGAWKHQWTDLTPWAGRSVTLRFKVTEAAGGARAWAYIDEVTVGSAHPDTWVRVVGQRAAPPGGQLTQDLLYGNRGGVAASNGYVTLQLPPELTFVSADPAPSMTSPELRWDVGDLAGPSDPGAIHVTLQVAPAAAPFTTVMTTVTIASDTAEIEQANNTAQATLFIGYMACLPVVWR